MTAWNLYGNGMNSVHELRQRLINGGYRWAQRSANNSNWKLSARVVAGDSTLPENHRAT